MGIKLTLISEDEKLWYRPHGESGFGIEYKRVPSTIRANVIKKCTKRGITDWTDAANRMFRWCVTGWDKVVGEPGGPDLEFDKSEIWRIPSDNQEDVLELAGANIDSERAREADDNAGKSDSTSDSKSKITD